MSGRQRRTDVFWLLWVTKRLTTKVQARPISPVRLLARLMFVCLGLGLFGTLFWNAAIAMPTGLWVIVGLGLTIRIVRWYLRRTR